MVERFIALFLGKRNSLNKHRIWTAALIRGRRLLAFLSQMRRLFEGGAYTGAALIRVNTVCHYMETVLGFSQSQPEGSGAYLQPIFFLKPQRRKHISSNISLRDHLNCALL